MNLRAAVAALTEFLMDLEAIEPQGWHRTNWGVDDPAMTFRRRAEGGDPATERESN